MQHNPKTEFKSPKKMVMRFSGLRLDGLSW